MTNPYVDPARVRAALHAIELRPTRAMGQNFLTDQAALAQIVAAGELRPDDRVLEIGPGLGVLTWELLRVAGQVVAVELDRRLAERLRHELPDPRLTIVQGDVLRFAPGELSYGRVADPPLRDPIVLHPSYKVVANLPYAITSAALRHLLEAADPPELIVVLVQWEVAQRIAAGPGQLSVLANSVQIYATPELVARVPARSFTPAPAVDSAVLRLRRRAQPAVADPTRTMRLIKAGFLHARKQLGNALPGGMAAMGMRRERDEILAALADAGVASERRAETLTLAEWEAIDRRLAR